MIDCGIDHDLSDPTFKGQTGGILIQVGHYFIEPIVYTLNSLFPRPRIAPANTQCKTVKSPVKLILAGAVASFTPFQKLINVVFFNTAEGL
jgi:hypothetical protein